MPWPQREIATYPQNPAAGVRLRGFVSAQNPRLHSRRLRLASGLCAQGLGPLLLRDKAPQRTET